MPRSFERRAALDDTPKRSMSLPRIYFEKLLENSPDIVVAVDRRGSIVFYNDGARQIVARRISVSRVCGR